MGSRKSRAVASVASVALAVTLATGAAWAQSPADIAARRELLQQAQAARDANDHTRALDLASRAGAIQMTPSVLLRA